MFDNEATIPIAPVYAYSGLVWAIMSPKYSEVRLAFYLWRSVYENAESPLMETI